MKKIQNLLFLFLLINHISIAFSLKKEIQIFRNGGGKEHIFRALVEISEDRFVVENLIEESLKYLWTNDLNQLLKHYHYFDLRDNSGKVIENTLHLKDEDDLYLVPRGEHW